MKLLMHTCCAPCSVYCIDELRNENIEPTVYWFNPNIHPYMEYKSRRDCLKEYTKSIGIDAIFEENYGLKEFCKNVVDGLDTRCQDYCYPVRLEQTAKYAKKNGFDTISTTLLVSPYQKHDLIKEVGEAGDKDGHAEEPQEGGGGGAQNELGAHPAGIARPEAAEEHGAVDEGLGIAPGDHTGSGRHLGQGQGGLSSGVEDRLFPQQPHADPHHHGSAGQQHDALEPGDALHQGPHAEETGQSQRDVKKDDDQGGQQGPPPGLGQGGVDDKQILHSDGGHVGQADGQALQKGGHGDSS